MKLYPSYYDNFACKASHCRHSCCLGWEICLDEETYRKYLGYGKGYSEYIERIDGGGRIIANSEDGRCPFLLKNGLCKIICDRGECDISEICREHPRFYNEIGGDIECGLGVVCEAAADLIINCRDANPYYDCISESGAFYAQRRRIIEVMLDSSLTLDESIGAVKNKYPSLKGTGNIFDWAEFLSSLEALEDDWHGDLLSIADKTQKFESGEFDIYFKRIAAYLLYRHTADADGEKGFTARVGFALLGVEIIRALFEKSDSRNVEKLLDIARRYSSEIEYSEENTDAVIFEFELSML